MGSPVPQEVSAELKRVVERWHSLPLDHALSRMPCAGALVQSLADRVTAARSRVLQPVPDLGPAVVMDQLSVMVHELFLAQPSADPALVAAELSGIRRAL